LNKKFFFKSVYQISSPSYNRYARSSSQF